jgi:Raf kinase inhibitor-like YbhB/YbcL family protein
MAEPNSPHLTSHSSGERITIQKVRPNEPARLVVRSAGVEAGGRIADLHSAYADNVSPALSWTNLAEADTYALVVEDPDAPMPEAFLHWVMWNIPGTASGLPQGITARELPPELKGAVQGRNSAGRTGYMGPRPPAGHGVHRYHFQVFALDGRLPDDPGLPFGELTDMLKAHTLAFGELVGTYERPEAPEAPTANRDADNYR